MLISFKTTFIINFRHEMLTIKCVVCIMFGIANKIIIFGSTIFKLENMKVGYWAMSKICKGRGKHVPIF